MQLRAFLMLGLAPVAAGPAFAQATPETMAAATRKAADPNEVVCERQRDPGSRLASAKVCHTRAEWAELRRQDRQMLDEAQTRRGMQRGH